MNSSLPVVLPRFYGDLVIPYQPHQINPHITRYWRIRQRTRRSICRVGGGLVYRPIARSKGIMAAHGKIQSIASCNSFEHLEVMLASSMQRTTRAICLVYMNILKHLLLLTGYGQPFLCFDMPKT